MRHPASMSYALFMCAKILSIYIMSVVIKGIDANIQTIVVSPQPEGEARELRWASQVVNETTMTEIELSISILYDQTKLMMNKQILSI